MTWQGWLRFTWKTVWKLCKEVFCKKKKKKIGKSLNTFSFGNDS